MRVTRYFFSVALNFLIALLRARARARIPRTDFY